MSFIHLVLTVLALGVGMALVSIIGLILDATRKPKNDPNAQTAVLVRSGSASQAIDELNKTAAAIFEELEEKRQELLTLYYMIEDRKKELMSEQPVKPKNADRETRAFQPNPNFKTNPKAGKIRAMHEKGMTEEQIARDLGIGQGEVKLVLNLGRGK